MQNHIAVVITDICGLGHQSCLVTLAMATQRLNLVVGQKIDVCFKSVSLEASFIVAVHCCPVKNSQSAKTILTRGGGRNMAAAVLCHLGENFFG